MIEPLNLQPGLFTEQSPRGAKGRWKNGDKVRFRYSLPEKIGGWSDITAGQTVLGICRQIFEWASLDSNVWTAIATDKKVYIFADNVMNDITPIRDFGSLTNPFTTTNGSAVVSVSHTAHQVQDGDYVRFSGASAVGGITINGEYLVTSVTGANTYEITHTSNATSAATGGGTVSYEYDVNTGPANESLAFGWGTGTWNTSPGWNEPRTASTFIQKIRIWSLDNWGEDLLLSPRSGQLYVWDKTFGVSTRATLVPTSPVSERIIMAQEQRAVFSIGSENIFGVDKLLIRWCSQEDYDDWEPGLTNSAGSARIETGSALVTAVKTRGEIVVFTDNSVHSITYVGAPSYYDVNSEGEKVSIMGPNAAISVDNRVFFMAQQDFYVYDGVASVVPCPVRNHVFDNLNRNQGDKVYAGINTLFREIWWFYPSSGASENDSYVVYNYEEKHWTYGSLVRTAWHDRGPAYLANPIAMNDSGTLYLHEDGRDDDGNAMSFLLESHDIELGDGEYMIKVSKIIPDLLEITGTFTIDLKTKQYPHTAAYTTKSYPLLTASVDYIPVRARGRQMAMVFSNNELGGNIRIGTIRYEAKPHGKR